MKQELLNCEKAHLFNEIPLLDFIYVIPTRKKHESGYMCMEIIGENKDGYKKKLATYSDVIDLDNVFGKKEWLLSMDIPEYGILRFFTHYGKFRINHYGISTFAFDIVERSDKE